MKYFNKIDGDRIFFSPINPNDYEIYTKWVNDPEVSDNLGINTQNYTFGKEKDLLESLSKDNNAFAIIEKETQSVIGNISLFSINNAARHCEVGIFIGNKKYRSNGFGAEALKLILNYGFNQLNLKSVNLRVFSYNTAAIKCYEKVGFKHAGRIRQTRFYNGDYHDEVIMDLLKSEFIA